jgi:protein arginine kinase activator
MLCQFCGKREATIHFTNMVGDKVQKIHLCRQCAEEKGFDYLKKSNIEKGDLLGGLMGLSGDSFSKERAGNVCPNCGMKYAFLKKGGLLGCSQCYSAFAEQLFPLLKNIHGDTRHTGKIPSRFGKEVSLERKITKLRDELTRAVEVENYEKAAQIRDKINKLNDSTKDGKQ